MLPKFLLVTLAFGFFFGSSLLANENPRETLKKTIDAALDAIYSDSCKDLSLEEKQAAVRDRIESNYDLDVIIRRSIGRNWGLMKDSEQQKVLELVKQLVVKAYVKGLDGVQRPEVSLGDVVKISDKRIEIESTVTLDGNDFYVLYRLGLMQSGWQIYDIVAENISVVSNYRQQIDDHFRKGSGADLITRLEELLATDVIDEDFKI